MTGQSRKDRADSAVAYHEAGHAVATLFLGGKLKRVTIVPETMADGRTSQGHVAQDQRWLLGLRSDSPPPMATLLAQRYIVTCLAGPLAQRRHAPRSLRSWHGHDDWNTAASVALDLCGTGKQASAMLRWLEIRAAELVEGRWKVIDRVALALLLHRTLRGADVWSIIVPKPQMGAIRIYPVDSQDYGPAAGEV